MAKNSAANLLTSVDSLFTTQEERDIATQPRVQEIPIDQIDDFPNHPFKVRMDDNMIEMAESVKQHGILVPAIVRPKENGHYEMVAGHRRKLACTLIAKLQLPCIVRELTDEEATLIMVDSNLQREQILPSEKAFAYKMKLEAMTSKAPARIADDVDETALSYSEIKALATGNPLIIEKCNLDVEVSKLNMLKANHLNQRFALENLVLRKYPADIAKLTEAIAGYEKDVATAQAHPRPAEGFIGMEIKGTHYSEKEAAGRAVINACTELQGSDPVPLGQYRGFSMSLQYDAVHTDYKLTMKGAMSHTICYLLGVFPRQKTQNHKRLHFLLREDLIKLDAITQEARLLAVHRIDTAEQLSSYNSELESRIADVTSQRRQLYRKQRTVAVKSDEAASAEVSTAIATLSKELSQLRREVKLCSDIAVRSGILPERIQEIQNSQRKEQNEHDQFRRCGRANR